MIVIGGGDTGTDCVGTSIGHGCSQPAAQFEVMPKPPGERAPDNPWPGWPKVYKMDYGQEEAAALFGAYLREYLIQTKRFVGDANGCVKELHTVRVEWTKDNGRMIAGEVPGSERVFPGEARLVRNGLPRAGESTSRSARRGKRMRGPTPRRNTASSSRASPAYSRPATCGAARVWWYGRSTKVAARCASATVG